MITDKSQIHPIAIGTFGLGADRFENGENGNERSIANKDEHLKVLITSFKAGQNYIETSFIYADGATMRFLADFFKQIPREDIFITVKLERFIENIEDIEKQLDKYLAIMGLTYVDSLILHAPSFSKLPLTTTYEAMYGMVQKGKTRYLSGSNLSLQQVKNLYENGIQLFSIEAVYNLECKVNEDNGLMKFCQDHDILFTCYQPLRRNRTANHNYPLLVELAEKYDKTQNQILINRIVKRKKLNPLIKASNEHHVQENLEALEFKMNYEDMQRLDKFRSEEFDLIADKIDREETGASFPIYKFANQCE